MKASLAIKTLIRAPMKTLLTFMLLAAVSGAFFFGASEYEAKTYMTRYTATICS